MSQHFVVVAYDISNDKRRTRLYKALLAFGTPVQFSIFECLLSGAELARMQSAVRKVIRPRLDHVRYYHLCEACQKKIVTTAAGAEPLSPEQTWLA